MAWKNYRSSRSLEAHQRNEPFNVDNACRPMGAYGRATRIPQQVRDHGGGSSGSTKGHGPSVGHITSKSLSSEYLPFIHEEPDPKNRPR